MISFYRIKSSEDQYFSDFYNLYKSSFPPNERRVLEDLEHELLESSDFYAHALIDDNEFVGIFNYWIFESFYYLEHFAVSPQMRGKNIGTQALTMFMSQVNLPIIMEVEMPNDLLSVRRVKFYNNLGIDPCSHSYEQPSYDRASTDFIPMLLLTDSVRFANSNFNAIKETIYTKVYHQNIDN